MLQDPGNYSSIPEPRFFTKEHKAAFKEFYREVMATPNNGMASLLTFVRTATGANTSALKVIRCDTKENINTTRVIMKDRKIKVLPRDEKGNFLPDEKEKIETIQEPHTFRPWREVIRRRIKENNDSLFFTVNSFYGQRKISNLCTLQNLFVDMDCHNVNEDSDELEGLYEYIFTFETAQKIMEDLDRRFDHDGIPKPFGVYSGRGMHLYWPIVGEGKKSLPLWTRMQKALAAYIRQCLLDIPEAARLEVDGKAQDAARIMRVPGSFNDKASTDSSLIFTPHDARITLKEWKELLEEYEEDSVTDTALPVIESKSVVVTPKAREAAERRAKALMAFAQSRNMSLEGYRNTFTMIFASTLFVCDPKNAYKRTLDFCSKFIPAQSAGEISAVIRCCAYSRYKFTNETIKNRLNMTDKEYEKFLNVRAGLKPISELRTFKSNKTRNSKRALHKSERMYKYSQIPVLRLSGMSYAEIAKKLGIGLRTVMRYVRTETLHSKNKAVRKKRIKVIRKFVSELNAKKKRFRPGSEEADEIMFEIVVFPKLQCVEYRRNPEEYLRQNFPRLFEPKEPNPFPKPTKPIVPCIPTETVVALPIFFAEDCAKTVRI